MYKNAKRYCNEIKKYGMIDEKHFVKDMLHLPYDDAQR